MASPCPERVAVPPGAAGGFIIAEPLWRVSVDGDDVEPHPVDVALTGVPLFAGAHTLDARLSAAPFVAGAIVSAISLAGVAALTLVSPVRRRRSRRRGAPA